MSILTKYHSYCSPNGRVFSVCHCCQQETATFTYTTL